MLDFNANDAHLEGPTPAALEEVRAQILGKLEGVLGGMFPAGKTRKSAFLIGDVLGSPGNSLEIVLNGEKAGLWTDRATGQGGDIFDLIAVHMALDIHRDFGNILQEAQRLCGQASKRPARKESKNSNLDELGPATAKWDYLDSEGKLLAVVYRYDPPGGRKEFRPWDAKRRRMAPPEPRPLFNQPGMLNSDSVVLVEGEKSAQALIECGVCATTAMHGANAPVDKTDWTPLVGKAVLIWPDKDKPGWEYVDRASQAILKSGARTCHILYPPEDCPEGWDAADARDEGFDLAGFSANGPRMQMHLVDDDSQDLANASGPEEAVWGTEDGLALSFTRRYHKDWRYVAGWGKWLVWDAQRWRSEDTLAAADLIRHVCRHASLNTHNPRIASKLAASSTVGGVERLARADRRHAATTEEWDADPWLLNTPGGVVDLRSGRLRPHERTDRMTKITTSTPRGECPQWHAFLHDVTGGDRGLQDYMQRMAGYALTGSTQEHALFFLYGTGANGKSVFVNTLADILGEYATNSPMETFMETRGDRHPTDMAGLRGARFVAAIETEQGRRWAESKVKSLTGGDKIAARFMRQDFFEFLPQFKLFVAGNHKPAIRNIDEAMKRRLHLIPFTITVPPEKRDKHLQQKLLAERDGILAWALDGCLAWQRLGRLDPPQQVVDATDEYFEAEDALGRWIDEKCVRVATAKSLTVELFSDWKQWADACGEYVGTQRRFSDLLITRGFEKWRNGSGVRGFQGIGLKAPTTPSYTPYTDN